jgi:hypothetical protein
VRVKKPRRAHSLSRVSMFRVFDVQENGEFVAAPVAWWLAGDDGGDPLAAGGRPGPAGCAAVAKLLPVLRSTGGVQMAMSIAVMAAGWAGRPSSRLRYREVAHLTLRALYRGRRAGSSVARTARPMAPGGRPGRPGVPGHCAAAPAVRVLPCRGLHRSTPRRAAQSALERH